VTERSANRDKARLTLLVRAGEMFHRSLDVTATLNNVARLAVESFADICLFDLIDERSEHLFVTAAVHRDPQQEPLLAAFSPLLYVEEFRPHPAVRVVRTGEPFFLPRFDDDALKTHAASHQHEHFMRRLGYSSKIIVPVAAHNRIFGALTFVRTHDARAFDRSDLSFANELGRRAGMAVANAKQYHREHYVAETLQRAFLSTHFPHRDDLELSAYYRPGSTDADIGGDWYDAFENEAGELVITIGDVAGKGIEGARLMILVRQAIRIAALEARDPRAIADLCNRVLLAEGGDRLASAFIGIIDPVTRELRYVSAGHTPPFLRLPGNDVRRLATPSAPLGAFRDVTFDLYRQRCPIGSMLVLYTDGLVECDRDALTGEDCLRRVLETDAVLHVANPAEFVERVTARRALRDDVAIIVVNFAPSRMRWQLQADDARSAHAMRQQYLRALDALCALDDDALASCSMIFSELIGNAVRHAPGPLSASLERRGDEIALHVIDTGPGFTYFPALPHDVWSEGGRGLYLISRLARAVEVEGLPGFGSHVTVTLPITIDEMSRLAQTGMRTATNRESVPL
jgi:anti-sigma regulatory factor (Ser/Thr protein kinase)